VETRGVTAGAPADSAGWAVLLPDDQEAFIVKDVQYDVLGVEMYRAVEEGVIKRGKSVRRARVESTVDLGY
jgi:outer membrane lipopolysaccharide assembly protein LptE/RlpB